MNKESEQKKKQCAVCRAYLFDDDDVVYCPVCGAPHHRDCYNTIGHCGYEKYHGTPQQYSKESEYGQPEPEAAAANNRDFQASDTTKCKVCGREYDDGAPACPYCGAPRMIQNRVITIDMLGGVPGDLDIGDGVTAEEAKRFVMANTPRYIPKFAAMKAGKKASWNWLAFLLPWAWFASRKMYLYAVITGFIGAASELLMLSLSLLLEQLGLGEQAISFMQIADSAAKLPASVIIMAVIGMLLGLALRIFCGISGDGIYRKHVISGVKYINAESADSDEDYRRMGGVSFWALLISILVIQYLPAIIAGFII